MPALKSDNPTRANINKNFLIRYQITGEKGTKLIGAGQYAKLVGEELKIKHFKRVLSSKEQQPVIKLRNRLKIIFQRK